MPTTTKTFTVDRPDGAHLKITIEERLGDPHFSDGFSVTGSLWEATGRRSGKDLRRARRDPDVSGCIHEEILAAAPQLAPVVAVHLADPEGLPMHAKANGWYFYSGGASAWERRQIAAGNDLGYSRLLRRSDHDRAADALHIDPADLPRGMTTREEFDTFVDDLAETYQKQAQRAREVIARLPGDENLAPAS